MNELELTDRIARLEAFVIGKDAANQACLQALLMAVDSAKAAVLIQLLAHQAAATRPSLPEASQQHFDSAIELALAWLGTSQSQ
jgi:hypothetical protein